MRAFESSGTIMTPHETGRPVDRFGPRDLGGRHAGLAVLLAILALVAAPAAGAQPSPKTGARAAAQTPDVDRANAPALEPGRGKRLAEDIKAYVTAPLHAKRPQWVRFGATLAAIGVAYEHDDNVRAHLIGSGVPPAKPDTHDSQDALPAALALGGTWLSAVWLHDEDGRREAGAMLEAAAFSSAAAFVIKEAAGRERPYVAGDSSAWHSGGDSFPSIHATAAFAIGTVLAESGNDRYRLIRRVLGYGIAATTAYRRVDHDAHWLSDTVAGAGLGVATARFVMQRRRGSKNDRSDLQLVPTGGGLTLAYTVALRR
jgi:PAP2 superfamily